MVNGKKSLNINITIGLTAMVLFTIILTTLIIHLPWLYISTKNIYSITSSLDGQIMNNVSDKVKSIFNSAIKTQRIIKNTIESGSLDLNNKEQLSNFYLDLIKANPNFTWISYGFPNKNFFGAHWENYPKRLQVADSVYNNEEKNADRKIKYYIKDSTTGKYIFEKERVENDTNYDATKRSWYKKALKNHDDVWTNVYVFSQTKEPGINSAIAIHDQKTNEFKGIVSIAIGLIEISNYLKTIQLGKNGQVFILDAKKQIIAFNDLDEIIIKTSKKGKPTLKKIDESNNQYLKIISNLLNEYKLNIDEITKYKAFNYQDPQTDKRYFISFKSANQIDWVIGTITPEDDYLAEVEKNFKYLFIAIAILMVFVLIFITFFTNQFLSKPIRKVAAQFDIVKQFDLSNVKLIPSKINEINNLSSSLVNMSQGLNSFKKYLPSQIVQDMISQGIKAEVGGEEKELTLFFSDLAGFTKLSEKLGNKLIFQLSEYFDEMSSIISENKGTIDKYIGDAIVAFWGAPIPNQNQYIDACRAAVKCQQVLKSLRINWDREGKPPFYQRIGINTGLVLVGNVGSNERLNYTVMGDAVNLASRLESLNSRYSTEIIIGESTYEKVKSDIVVRELDHVRVKGKDKEVKIYEILALKEDLKLTDQFDWLEYYERGLREYQKGNWKEAIDLFNKTLNVRGGHDGPSSLFISLCHEYLIDPPVDGWDGVTILNSK